MKKNGIIFILGGCLYPALEVVWRGYTHLSMALVGGLCLCLIDCVCVGALDGRGLWVCCLAGASLITGVELVAGLVLNNLMGLNVWDYSAIPMNILGQVCLPYSVLWFWLTIPAMALCRLCRKTLEAPPTIQSAAKGNGLSLDSPGDEPPVGISVSGYGKG